jgi:hypothetical protein
MLAVMRPARQISESSAYEPVDPVIAGTFVGIARKDVDILLNAALRVSDTTRSN